MADSTGDPVVGATLAGYRIERRLGRGGMSVVYLAEDVALGRKVALKVRAPELSEDQSFRERFRLESRLAASIDHPNVIPIYEAGDAEGQLYIAMRYVQGIDLRHLIDDEGALEPTRAVELVARVADGLEAAHRRGLVHRDVKPSNVLIAAPGEDEHVYLADLGLTKAAESEEEAREVAQLSGTTDYVAPELITEARAGTGADLYALGCVLYETLTGTVPFPRNSELETLVAHVDERVPKPSQARPELPAALDAVVERAMAKDPTERYQSAAELAAAARATLPSAGRSRRLAVALAAAAAVLAGTALAAVFLTRSDTPGPNAPTTELVATGAVQRVDQQTGKLEATVRITGQPLDLTTGAGAVWLADDGDDVVHRIDLDSYERAVSGVRPDKRVGAPQALASSADLPWLGAWGPTGHALVLPVTPPSVRATTVVDLQVLAQRSGDPGPPLQTISQLVPDGSSPSETFTGWLIDASEGIVRRLQIGTTGRILSPPIATGGAPHIAAADSGNLWVGQGREIVALVRSRITSRTPLPGTPTALTVTPAGVWAATTGRRLVLVRRDGTVARRLRTRGRPVDLELADGALWLLQAEGELAKIDAATGDILTTEMVGSNAVALAADSDSVWVAVRGGRPLERSALPMRARSTTGSYLDVPMSCGPPRSWAHCREAFAVFMRTDDGVRAGYGGYVWERRRRGGRVECQGTVHRGPAISDVESGGAGAGSFWIEGWGTMALRFRRVVVVAERVSGETICGEGAGTWIATAGPLKGERGTFVFLAPEPIVIVVR